MPKAGDKFIITLKKSHLQWGTHRYTGTRGLVYGEGYIPIPLKDARKYGIFNSNSGLSAIYNCTALNGTFSGAVLAQGNSKANDIYAKQFAGKGNLKAIGSWYASVNAQIGDHVEVVWTSPTDITIRHF